VSTAGAFLGQFSDTDSNLTVNVESAGMSIPIVQHSTAKVERVP
jgi:hypothetical protein